MAPRRMARRRGRANQILALNLARRYAAHSSRRGCQTALAHRAGLRGSQRGTRAGPLRRPGMAGLPSSCHAVHRRLRLADLRTGRDSPLGDPETPSAYTTPPRPTRRIRRSAPNATSQPPSRPSENGSPSLSPKRSSDARAAKRRGSYPPLTASSDAVELTGC